MDQEGEEIKEEIIVEEEGDNSYKKLIDEDAK